MPAINGRGIKARLAADWAMPINFPCTSSPVIFEIRPDMDVLTNPFPVDNTTIKI